MVSCFECEGWRRGALEVHNFLSFTLAIVLLFIGKVVLERSPLLQRYSLPEAVVGGFLAAIVVSVLYFAADMKVTFALDSQPFLLLYFFAGIGLKSDVRDLITGGRPLAVMIALVAVFIVMQNLLGHGRRRGTRHGSQSRFDDGVGLAHRRPWDHSRLGADVHRRSSASPTRSKSASPQVPWA